MKIRISLFILLIFSLVLTGCGNTTSNEEEQDEFVTSTAYVEVEENEGLDYVGTWNRVDTYVDGVPQNSDPATIVMEPDYYISSTAVCTVQGALTVMGDQMNMLVEPNDCPGWTLDSLSYTYSIEKNEDEKTMTFTVIYAGVEVKEIYKNKE